MNLAVITIVRRGVRMPQTLVDIAELPARFEELVQLAAAGAEVVVTDGDVPRARLLPVPTPAPNGGVPRVPGLHAGMIRTTADFDAPLSWE